MTCFGGNCPWLKHGKCTSLYMPSPDNPRAVAINPNFNTVVIGRVVECTQHMAIKSRFELCKIILEVNDD